MTKAIEINKTRSRQEGNKTREMRARQERHDKEVREKTRRRREIREQDKIVKRRFWFDSHVKRWLSFLLKGVGRRCCWNHFVAVVCGGGRRDADANGCGSEFV
jgi:hypothetical protein